MTDRSDTEAEPTGYWPPKFRGGIGPLLAVLLAVIVIGVANNSLQARVLGPDPSFVVDQVSQFPSYVVLATVAALALRYEGVKLQEIGLDRDGATSALVAIVGFVVVLNVVVAAMVTLTGQQLSVGLYGLYARVLDHTPVAMAVGAASAYLVVGPVEELVFRGYLQNKLIRRVGGESDRRRAALGIVLTAVVFALIHVPDLVLQEGVSMGGMVGSLLLLTISALVFGTIYESTQNLVLVALLHGLGDYWPLVVDPGAWPNWGIVILLYGLLVVTYRRWITTPSFGSQPGTG